MKLRTKGKRNASVTTKDFYKFYKSSIEKNTVYDITKTQYTAILKYLNTEISKLIITENFEYSIVPNMGILCIRKYKKKLKLDEKGNLIKTKLPVNYMATKQLWERDPKMKEAKKLIYFINEHSDGYMFKFFWDKTNCRTTNKNFYMFKASRTNNRLINTAISTIEHLDYFEFSKIHFKRKENVRK